MAEILRRTHRICARCRLGPTHIYDPPTDPSGPAADDPEAEAAGEPLCNACLAVSLSRDFLAFAGRALVFEPALGPEALLFQAIDGGAERVGPAAWHTAVAEALAALPAPCARCGAEGRFRWVGVEHDANLWPEEIQLAYSRGDLAASDVLCGGCAAAALMRSLEERGLYLDAIVPPRGGDGVMLGGES